MAKPEHGGPPRMGAPSLVGRALLALGLLIGFYVLALAIAGVLLFIPYAEWTYLNRLDLRIAFFCVVGALLILGAILPRSDRFTAPGPRLDPAKQPQLFAVVAEIARRTGQDMPAEVYLVPDVNAWVAQRGGVMGFGSRRVMGIGLPLLRVLSVSELRAVLAHEFGHFYGGDTRLGPWIYKTRAAIGRALLGLSRHSSVLQIPFVWYGKMFLRITHGISRRQEFIADELAAHVAGAHALIDGLQAVHGAAPAFQAYWATEVIPVLSAGYRPPLADGFLSFLTAAPVAPQISEILEQEIAHGKSDPYDTHPALRERIAAAKHLPPGRRPASDPPAIALLADVPGCEAGLVAALVDTRKVLALKPTTWDSAGAEIYLPRWENLVERQKVALTGLTPATLPDVLYDPVAFGRRLGGPAVGAHPREELTRRTVQTLATALTVALQHAGWELHTPPGDAVFCTQGSLDIAPFGVVNTLVSGELDADTWREQCKAAGTSDLLLGPAGAPPAPVAHPVAKAPAAGPPAAPAAPTPVPQLTAQGYAALRAGQPGEARRLFRLAVQRDARNEEAWLGLAETDDTVPERRLHLKRVLEINPANATAQQRLAVVLERDAHRR